MIRMASVTTKMIAVIILSFFRNSLTRLPSGPLTSCGCKIQIMSPKYRETLGASEAVDIGCEHAQTPIDENRDHVPVEVAPGRLAVHAQHDRAVARALVEVMDAQRSAVAVVHFGVVRREREAGQVLET